MYTRSTVLRVDALGNHGRLSRLVGRATGPTSGWCVQGMDGRIFGVLPEGRKKSSVKTRSSCQTEQEGVYGVYLYYTNKY